LGYELRRRYLRRHYTVDSMAGAALGAFLGVVLAWVVGVAAAQMNGLKDTVRGSEVITQLNSALPPPGPIVNPDRTYDIRLAREKGDRSATPGDRIKHARAVENAALSVLKIEITGCDGRGEASGWIAAKGIVVTNAHVPYRSRSLGVKVEGAGKLHKATPISFDVTDDVSVLRVPGVRGVPSLRVGPVARKGQLAAVLGFPFGGIYKARAARIGRTSPRLIYREPGDRNYLSTVTRLRSDIGPGPGSSGGPIVDKDGRVVAMTSAGDPRHFGRHQFAVPSSSIKRDLKRALASPRPGLDTGGCEGAD
jgi:S1-C subfamily serine protease